MKGTPLGAVIAASVGVSLVGAFGTPARATASSFASQNAQAGAGGEAPPSRPRATASSFASQNAQAGAGGEAPPSRPRATASSFASQNAQAGAGGEAPASRPRAVEDPLATAQRAYGDVDYAKCKDAAEKALAVPADKPSRVDAYRLIGLCNAALGDTDKARDAFKHMLAIDKDARIPDGLSPRFTSAFREAKGAFVTGSPLGFTVQDEKVDGGTRTMRIKLVDELDLVQKIAWRTSNGQLGPPVRAAPVQELQLPADVDVTVVALDAGGGEVAVLLLAAKKKDVAPPTPPTTTAEDKPFPWVAVAGIAGGVVLVGGGAAVAYALLAPPSKVTLKTDVVFGQ